MPQRDENVVQVAHVAVDTAADHLVEYLNTVTLPGEGFTDHLKQLQRLAIKAAGTSAEQLEHCSENDPENPYYELYWATLTNLMQKVLVRAADKLSF